MVPEHRPPPSWPVLASIKYENAVLHYNPDAEPVLRNVSFEIGNNVRFSLLRFLLGIRNDLTRVRERERERIHRKKLAL